MIALVPHKASQDPTAALSSDREARSADFAGRRENNLSTIAASASGEEVADPRLARLPATETMTFAETVRLRRAIRAFGPDPLPSGLVEEMLYEASLSPSNCNTQPWIVHLVRGDALKDLATVLTTAFDRGEESLDYSFDAELFEGDLRDRQREHGAILHGAQGTDRNDRAGRLRNTRRNLEFFGAPHVLFLFMPHIGDGVRVASDVGMFAQTFLLALTARGLGGVPQAMLGMYAQQVRQFLDVSADHKLLFGISFGHIDDCAPVNGARTPRATEFAIVHDKASLRD